MEDNNILGCYASITQVLLSVNKEQSLKFKEEGELFLSYLWGDKGLAKKLKQLNRENYGQDMNLILLQFYINPTDLYLEKIRPVGYYRRKEHTIGLSIFVDDSNFFNKSESERHDFFMTEIISKLDLLKKTVIRNKLDTNIPLLQSDVKNLLSSSASF